MKTRIFAAALLVAVATPALAQGIDSRHSPYPESAYSGYAGASFAPAAPSVPPTAYRFSGPHAGGPADGLRY